MNSGAALKRAFEYSVKINNLLKPINNKLANILEDECAHVTIQPGDGLVIAYRGGIDNAAIIFLPPIHELLNMQKEQLLRELDKAGI